MIALQRLAGNAAVARELRSRRDATPAAASGGGSGLPPSLRRGMEALSGVDLSDVRVVRRSPAPEQLDARAFAMDDEIHLGAGQEEHLPHEAWHVVQQRQGRVPGTTSIGRTAVNDDPALEREADIMGARAAASASPPAAVPRFAGRTRTSIAQRKSTITPHPKQGAAETPLATLSCHFKPFFTAAGVAEQYNFTGLGLLDGSEYAATWDRAGQVVAVIDPASASKASGSNRNNQVIGPYGHFGAMERSIFDRPRLGNTYDGGHLVEHTLMEGQDADVEGNLAPQENKNFNQGLMRGWESVPEKLMHSGHTFRYTVEVKYSDDTYVRTGAQLLKAGVLGAALPNGLPATGPWTKASLNAETVTFVRWIPYRWRGEVEAPTGMSFPQLTLTKGTHLHNLQPDKATAKGVVLGPSTAVNTAVSGKPPLRRQNSGTLAGTIEGATATTTGFLLLGAGSRLRAHMYQPEPQDTGDQPNATTTPTGAPPAVLPVSTQPTAILSFPLSVSTLTTQLSAVRRLKNTDKVARKKSSLFDSLRKPLKSAKKALLPNAKCGHLFVVSVQKALESKGIGATTLTPAEMIKAVRETALPKDVKRALLLLELDPSFQA